MQLDEGTKVTISSTANQSIDHQLSTIREQEQQVPHVSVKESWNNPRRNILKLIAVYYGFLVFGMADSSVGVLVPTLQKEYNKTALVVSFAFFSPSIGYCTAALLSNRLHGSMGRWGVAIAGTCLQSTAYIINVCGPPFPLYIVAYAVLGFGNGLIQASWNAWCAGLEKNNIVLGILHGFYALGGNVCTSVVTAILNTHTRWFNCFFFLLAANLISVLLSSTAFAKDTPARHLIEVQEIERQESLEEKQAGASVEAQTLAKTNDKKRSLLIQTLQNKAVLLFSCMLFVYVGGEVTLGGWTSSFMIHSRKGDPKKMGFVTTGYWTGLTLGRMILGFLVEFTHHEEMVAALYIILTCGLILVFFLVPSLYVSAVAVSLVGVTLGPLFPTVTVVAAKKLPRRLHISGLGFASSFGGIGAAFVPFAAGAWINSAGTDKLGPFALILFGSLLIMWMILIFRF